MAELQAKGFSTTEVLIIVDILGYIESQREMGATTTALKEKYEDKIFLLNALGFLLERKLVLKAGLCQITYVHAAYVNPWIINTYHLKRLDRVRNECNFLQKLV